MSQDTFKGCKTLDEFTTAAHAAGIKLPSDVIDVGAVVQYLREKPQGPALLTEGDYVLRVERSEICPYRNGSLVWASTFTVIDGTPATPSELVVRVESRINSVNNWGRVTAKSFGLAVLGLTETAFNEQGTPTEQAARLEAVFHADERMYRGVVVRCTVTKQVNYSRTYTRVTFAPYIVPGDRHGLVEKVSDPDARSSSGEVVDFKTAVHECMKHGVAPLDPDYAQRLQRRAVDKLLAEDARAHPAFAVARRAAVVALHEDANGKPRHPGVECIRDFLDALHTFESARGVGVTAHADSWNAAVNYMGVGAHALSAYERARGTR